MVAHARRVRPLAERAAHTAHAVAYVDNAMAISSSMSCAPWLVPPTKSVTASASTKTVGTAISSLTFGGCPAIPRRSHALRPRCAGAASNNCGDAGRDELLTLTQASRRSAAGLVIGGFRSVSY